MESRLSSNGNKCDADGTGEDESRCHIEWLQQLFAKFRQESRPHTRIPVALRSAALIALQSGARADEIRRACGLTSEQLAKWQQEPQICGDGVHQPRPPARVFDVVDEPRAVARAGKSDQSLELRVGEWVICIRQDAA